MSAPFPLRLALHGFMPAEAAILSDMVHAAAMGWSVADAVPIDAVLLARGSREGDPEHSAVLRVKLDHRPLPASNERRMEPLLLRKPIRVATLRMALTAARTRLEIYGQADAT